MLKELLGAILLSLVRWDLLLFITPFLYDLHLKPLAGNFFQWTLDWSGPIFAYIHPAIFFVVLIVLTGKFNPHVQPWIDFVVFMILALSAISVSQLSISHLF